MQKKLRTVLLTGVLAASLAMPAYAQNETIRIDGVTRRLTVASTVVDGYRLVNMREICNMLGAVTWEDETTGETVAKGAGTEIRLKIGSADALVNGKKVTMPVPAQSMDGYTMVSMRFAGEAFGYSVEWDTAANEAGFVKVPAAAPEEAVAPNAEPLPLIDFDALDTGKIKLGYDEAVGIVVEKNSSIKDLNDLIRRSEQQRGEIYHDAIFTSNGLISPGYIAGLRAISGIDFEIKNKPLYTEMYAAGAESALRSSISTIAKARMDMALLDESIRLSKFNIENNLELKLELGLVSENDVTEARRKLVQLQNQRDAALLALSADKESIALMLGYKADADISVDYRPVFVEGGIDMAELIRGIDRSPSIVVAERQLKQAEYEYDTSLIIDDTFMQGQRQESKAEKLNQVMKRRRALEDAKTEMESSIRSAYNSIKALEETQKALSLALEQARDTYATALVSYEAGMVTQYDTDLARMAILEAEIKLEKNVYSLDSLRFMIQRPYMLSAMPAAG